MILHIRVWESSSMPDFFYQPDSYESGFFFAQAPEKGRSGQSGDGGRIVKNYAHLLNLCLKKIK